MFSRARDQILFVRENNKLIDRLNRKPTKVKVVRKKYKTFTAILFRFFITPSCEVKNPIIIDFNNSSCCFSHKAVVFLFIAQPALLTHI